MNMFGLEGKRKLNAKKTLYINVKNEPKMFYRFINKKMKQKVGIYKLRVEGTVYEEEEGICEVMNRKFQEVFTTESDFERNERGRRNELVMENIRVERKDVFDRMGNLDGRKAVGPDGIAGMILKECREQLVYPVREIIEASLKEGKVPEDWKKAHMVPIHKGGNSEDP